MNVRLPLPDPEPAIPAAAAVGALDGTSAVPTRRQNESLSAPWIGVLRAVNHMLAHTVGAVAIIAMAAGAAWTLQHLSASSEPKWFKGTRFETPVETVMQIADSIIFIAYVFAGIATTMVVLWREWKDR